MPLQPGTRLGPYDILAPVGAGGMGEVYRARDTRLDRDVAIKVSSTEFSERFTREARSIAALNHTNICHLYDVGPNYLVLEYIEGQNLVGPMSWDEALPIVRQLIDGIEAARRRIGRITRTAAIEPYIGQAGSLRAAWKDLPLNRQRAIVSAVLDRAVIGRAVRGRIRFDPARVNPIWRV